PLPRRTATMEEAQRAPSSPVWIPSPLAVGWQRRTVHMPAEERPPTPEAVSIHYSRDDASHQFSIHETNAAERDPWEGYWEPEPREWNGEEMLVATEPQARVRLERNGTQIVIQSEDLELEWLLGLVDLLVPAPDEPPPLAT